MSNSMASKAVVWGSAEPPQPDIPVALWGVGSTRALRAHWMLAEPGVPYVSSRIQSRTGETKDRDYLKLNAFPPCCNHLAMRSAEGALFP